MSFMGKEMMNSTLGSGKLHTHTQKSVCGLLLLLLCGWVGLGVEFLLCYGNSEAECVSCISLL
jgi:hypothetical protein